MTPFSLANLWLSLKDSWGFWSGTVLGAIAIPPYLDGIPWGMSVVVLCVAGGVLSAMIGTVAQVLLESLSRRKA